MFDCDVHPLVRGGIARLGVPRSRSAVGPGGTLGSTARPAFRHNNPSPGLVAGALRRDAVPPDGGLPGEDPRFVVDHLLDPFGVEWALLIPLVHEVWADSEEGAAIAAAVNEYMVDTWLGVDERFALCMCVAPGDPVRAADAVRSLGGLPRVVAVFVPLEDKLLGDGAYEPILAAAEETGMTVLLHPTGAEGTHPRAAHLAGGPVATYVERHVAVSTVAAANLASLVDSESLARHPSLQFAFIEFGFSWVAPLMARLDAQWEVEGGIADPPSEAIVDRVFFGTQPVEEPAASELMSVVAAMRGERSLLFASDYPHWDTDHPARVLHGLARETREAILHGNARRAFPRAALGAAQEVPAG